MLESGARAPLRRGVRPCACCEGRHTKPQGLQGALKVDDERRRAMDLRAGRRNGWVRKAGRLGRGRRVDCRRSWASGPCAPAAGACAGCWQHLYRLPAPGPFIGNRRLHQHLHRLMAPALAPNSACTGYCPPGPFTGYGRLYRLRAPVPATGACTGGTLTAWPLY
jgi:hypothetical protein